MRVPRGPFFPLTRHSCSRPAMIGVDVALGLRLRSPRGGGAPVSRPERQLQFNPPGPPARAGRLPVMDRLLSLMLFLVLQGAAALTALRCQGPVCDWVAGGYWVAPAVRVPLVALAIVVVELIIL